MARPPEDATFAAHEHAGWEVRASGYDDYLGRVTSEIAGPLLDAARVAAGTGVLDVACGPGSAAGRSRPLQGRARGQGWPVFPAFELPTSPTTL